MFSNKNSGSGYKFGANKLVLNAEYKSPRTDGTGGKELILSIPDTYNRKIVWKPIPNTQGKQMPFKKYTFFDGTSLAKGAEMTVDQANRFDQETFATELGRIAKAFGVNDTFEAKTLDEYITLVAKAINGKSAWIKMVFAEEESKNGKYYLEIFQGKKGWYSDSESGIVITDEESAHAAKCIAHNTGTPNTDVVSKDSELPFF